MKISFTPICYLCQDSLGTIIFWCEGCGRIPYCSLKCAKLDIHQGNCPGKKQDVMQINEIFSKAICSVCLDLNKLYSFFSQCPPSQLHKRYCVTVVSDERKEFLAQTNSLYSQTTLTKGPVSLNQKDHPFQRTFDLRMGLANVSTLVVKYWELNEDVQEVHLFRLIKI